ncbi:MAG TPA: DOMON-like domain-containing protein [Xanthobacteraceae bacterium]|nr:DOMON-like domain-containing protein [Xanthobacteraceae bacterium]
MRVALKIHPDSRCPAVHQVEVEAARPQVGALVLRYVVDGDMRGLVLPPVAEPARTDALWQHTCFEAFIRPGSEAAYYEFNFAPSTRWAAYRFDGYREGMRAADQIGALRIEVDCTPERYTLQVALQCDESFELARATWHVGFSAVLEAVCGDKSYWALAHPPGKPDFHHADCFVAELK